MKRGHLNVPVIGVAKAGWNLDQLRARAKDSLEKHGGLDPAAFEKLIGLLRYVDGDYQDPATFKRFARATQGRKTSRALPGDSAGAIRNRRGTSELNRIAAAERASSSRSPSGTIWHPRRN